MKLSRKRPKVCRCGKKATVRFEIKGITCDDKACYVRALSGFAVPASVHNAEVSHLKNELAAAQAALAYVTVLDETFTGVVFYSIVGRPFLPGEKHYEAIDAAFKARRLAHATSAETARGEGGDDGR